jgi:coenzyme F420-dependent oxidoreductase
MSATDAALDLVLTVGDHDTLDSVAEQARIAEEYGFARVSMGEVTGWNSVSVLTTVAERTTTIGLSNDVFSAYSRSPALLGQTALTLHEASGGRYRLGLGPSSPALAERWHGESFERPLRRLRETIDIVREVHAGGDVEYDGEYYELGGLSYDRQPPDTPPRIDVAALGPKGVELAGRFADGWVPQLFTPDGLDDRLDDLERGADLGRRDAEDLRVSPLVRCFAHEEPEHARAIARQTIAFLIGAYGPFYGDSLARQGHEDVVETIRAAWADRDTAAMAAALPDGLLDDLAAAGTPGTVRERVDRFADVDGVDAVRVGFVSGMTREDEETTMEALSGAT